MFNSQNSTPCSKSQTPTVKLTVLESTWLRSIATNDGLPYAQVPSDYAAVTFTLKSLQGRGLIKTVEKTDSPFRFWYEITDAGRSALGNGTTNPAFRRMAAAFCDEHDADELEDLHKSLDNFIKESENILSADEAFEMYFRNYPGWHSFEWEYNFNRFNRAVAMSNAGPVEFRSAWEKQNYLLHSGKASA